MDLLDSHVGKTDEIKDFVITEESSIAKGIRRIVAVTGQEAHEASRGASEFSKRLDWIDSLNGKEKDAALKPFLVVSSAGAQDLGRSRC
jgi:alanyl-tRNA synthetase